jgi:hypothetical protein
MAVREVREADFFAPETGDQPTLTVMAGLFLVPAIHCAAVWREDF